VPGGHRWDRGDVGSEQGRPASDTASVGRLPRNRGAVPLDFAPAARRILDALRDAPADDWARLDAPLGDHDAPALEIALAGLAREGLAERHPSDPRLARLPLA
jgi:hypothetical protein